MDHFHHYRAGKLHFFCPLCHYHQSTNTIQRMKAKHHGQLGLLTAAIAFAAWPLFGVKGFFLYFFFWLVFEIGYRLRKRQALICQSCGFDPFLYKQDIQKARRALKQHWETRIETENLFAGKKLKNYQTKGVNLGASSSTENASGNSAGKNTNAPDLSL